MVLGPLVTRTQLGPLPIKRFKGSSILDEDSCVNHDVALLAQRSISISPRTPEIVPLHLIQGSHEIEMRRCARDRVVGHPQPVQHVVLATLQRRAKD